MAEANIIFFLNSGRHYFLNSDCCFFLNSGSILLAWIWEGRSCSWTGTLGGALPLSSSWTRTLDDGDMPLDWWRFWMMVADYGHSFPSRRWKKLDKYQFYTFVHPNLN
jgi:hypothetical protein